MIGRAAALILVSACLLIPARARAADAVRADDQAFANALFDTSGKLEPVKRLLGDHASPRRLGLALNNAAFFGELETVRYLLAHGAAVDARSLSGWTPLISALADGDNDRTELVKYLIEKGADVNAADENEDTPLIRAAERKKGAEAAKLLIAKGARVNAAAKDGGTPLSEAISNGNEETSRILLAAGADANARLYGDPVLYLVSLHGNTALTKLLLEHGADPRVPDKTGDLPLSNAIDNPEMAEAMLEHGADPNAVLKRMGAPALTTLSGIFTDSKPAYTETAKVLIAHGANVNAVDKDGCTILQTAVRARKPDIAAALVRAGADVGVNSSSNCSAPLTTAAENGQLELVKLLFEAGSTESVSKDLVCFDFQSDWKHPTCPKDQILAMLANPPAPVLQLARIAKEMREAKAPAATAAPAQAAAAKPAEPKSDVDEPRYHSAQRPDDLAVVVGIEKYDGGLPDATFAERDAQAVRRHLLALGYPERNIFMLTGENATRSGLVKNLETRLPALTKPDSTVFFYYSGHGAPDAATGKAYLLPVDGDPEFLKDTAYPLSRLYAALGKLPAKRVIVALDSCFSGAGGRSVLPKGARPLVVKIDSGALPGRVVALTASSGSQISGVLDAQGHGAFTYYLLRGLNGAAKGDDGKISVQSLYDYLTPNVEDAARRDNRDQAPQLLRGEGERNQRVPLR